MDYRGDMDGKRVDNTFAGALGIILALVLLLWALLGAPNAEAQEYGNAQIVNAIYIIEGGPNAQYLYGIRSVHYDDEAEARRICFNTVRNNRARFARQSKYDNYLDFLASRYCPIGAANDPRGLNVNWLRNLRYYLNKGA